MQSFTSWKWILAMFVCLAVAATMWLPGRTAHAAQAEASFAFAPQLDTEANDYPKPSPFTVPTRKIFPQRKSLRPVIAQPDSAEAQAQ